MAYNSYTRRHLAPTVGPAAAGADRRAEPRNGVIGDNVAIGRVLYAGNMPIVANDQYWIPAKENVTDLYIVPFGSIDIFIGYTPDRSIVPSSRPARTAIELDTFAEVQSEAGISDKFSALDLKNSRPTQTALGQDITVEDRCRSARVIPAFETQRCHFVAHVGTINDSTSTEELPADESVMDVLEEDFDSQFDPEGFEKYQAEYDADMAAVVEDEQQPPATHQVLATLTDAVEDNVQAAQGGNQGQDPAPIGANAGRQQGHADAAVMPPPASRVQQQQDIPPSTSDAPRVLHPRRSEDVRQTPRGTHHHEPHQGSHGAG